MTTTTDTATFVDDELLTTLRERLERDRAELLDQLQTTSEPLPEATATTGQGETEHVASEVEQRVQDTLDAGMAARLAELDDALRRLDHGTYGRCERCGTAIPAPRLEALPHARLCMTCQIDEDAERRPRLPR